jgi:predicted HTH domain antitoxin
VAGEEHRNMPLIIPDELLQEAGLTEEQARVEIACRLFGAGLVSKPAAGKWAGLTRTQFETALLERGLPLVYYTLEDFEQDLRSLAELDARSPCPS